MENTLINKKQSFTQIENCILKNPLLSDSAKLVYAVINSYAFNKDTAFPGQQRVAYELNKSTKTVQRALNELRGHSLLSWEQRGLNKPNIYTIENIPRAFIFEYEKIQVGIALTVKDKDYGELEEARKGKRREEITEEIMVSRLSGQIKGQMERKQKHLNKQTLV